MFRITRDPSSGSSILGLNYSNCSIASVEMDVAINTDYIHINAGDRTITVILAKHCIELPDDGSLVIRNMLEQI